MNDSHENLKLFLVVVLGGGGGGGKEQKKRPSLFQKLIYYCLLCRGITF